MRHRTLVIVGVLAIGLALAGIAAATGSEDDEAANVEASDSETGTDGIGFDDPVSFVGMPKDEAIARAESEGRLWRVGMEDGESFALTADLNPGRVTFEIIDGIVSAAEIEEENTDPPPPGPPVFEDAGQAQLIADAVRRLTTTDNGFGGRDVFDEIIVGRFIAGDPARPLQSLDLEMIAGALADIGKVTFVDDTVGEIEARFDDQTALVAVVTVADLLLLDDHAEVGMELWCGSLCGVFLTYGAEPAPDGWSITGLVGPIAMS
jgi:hypothetical protein